MMTLPAQRPELRALCSHADFCCWPIASVRAMLRDVRGRGKPEAPQLLLKVALLTHLGHWALKAFRD